VHETQQGLSVTPASVILGVLLTKSSGSSPNVTHLTTQRALLASRTVRRWAR